MVHHVRQKGLILIPGISGWSSFSENKWDLLAENLITFAISLTISSASRMKVSILLASCKPKFRECAKQWTGSADGISALISVARPFLLQCILARAGPLQSERGREQQTKMSFITV